MYSVCANVIQILSWKNETRIKHDEFIWQETEGLEQKKQSLQEEIQQLQQAKDELEFILEAHRAVCRLRSASPPDVKPVIKPELPTEDQFAAAAAAAAAAAESTKRESVNVATRPNRPNSLPVGFDNNNRPNSLSIFSEPKERPNTLTFKTVETPSFMKPSLDVAGMPITTPTSGIAFNFESLMEGGTGLTPVSTPLIPSCSTQQRNNLSAVDLSSPDANPPKLVSLWRQDDLDYGSNEDDPEWDDFIKWCEILVIFIQRRFSARTTHREIQYLRFCYGFTHRKVSLSNTFPSL